MTLAALAACIVAGAIGAWSVLVEPDRLVTRTAELRLENWPQRLDGLRVALISDLHAGALHVDRRKIRAVVRRANATRPDVTLVLGDVLAHGGPLDSPLPQTVVARELGGLRARLGVFAVLGNHEWRDDGLLAWRDFEAAGLNVLGNQAARVGPSGDRFWLAGVADEWTAAPDAQGALAQVPSGAPVLAMTHNPNAFTEIPSRVALTVAGHTHGGQINLPLVRRLFTPTNGSNYRAGEYADHGRRFYVSSGIGTSHLPARLRNPPAVELLVLRAGRHR